VAQLARAVRVPVRLQALAVRARVVDAGEAGGGEQRGDVRHPRLAAAALLFAGERLALADAVEHRRAPARRPCR
jgi:hypothetical protein